MFMYLCTPRNKRTRPAGTAQHSLHQYAHHFLRAQVLLLDSTAHSGRSTRQADIRDFISAKREASFDDVFIISTALCTLCYLRYVQISSGYSRLCIPADYFTSEVHGTTLRRGDFTSRVSANGDDTDYWYDRYIFMTVRTDFVTRNRYVLVSN